MKNEKSASNIKNKFSNGTSLPYEFRVELTNMNLKRLFYLDWVFLVSAILLFVLYLMGVLRNGVKYENLFCMGYITTTAISLILTFLFRKHTNLPIFVRTIPLTLSYIVIMLMCVVIFYIDFPFLNALLIFVCLTVLIPIFFTVPPLFYNSVLILTYIAVFLRLKPTQSISFLVCLAVFVIMIGFFSIFKWRTTKNELILKDEQNQRTKLLEKEINLAAFVQNSFYKHIDLKIEGWNIEYFSEPMAGVSGDMHDIYTKGNNLEGLGVFDVSGHGISSGLVTMLVKNIIQQEFELGKEENLQTVMKRINDRIIIEKGDIENYLTGILTRIHDNKVELINAGNPPPIIHKAETNESYFYETNELTNYGVIGMADFPVGYSVNTIEMQSGDSILFYTDGITENCNDENTPYGKKNLMQVFKNNTYKTSKDQLADIVSDYKKFKGDARSSDDITLLILKKL